MTLIEKLLLAGMLLLAVGIILYDQVNILVQNSVVVYAAETEETKEGKVVLIEVEIDWTPERIKKEVWDAAARYNTFPEKMWNVMLCENRDLIIDQQSLHIYSFSDPSRGIYKGNREMSYGLAQIHLPDHNVTHDQAIDPKFAIDFMAKHFAEGHASWWTCYRKIYQ